MVRWWLVLVARGVAECWVPGSGRATCWYYRNGLTAERLGGRAPCKSRSWCLRQASPSRWPKASDAGRILMSHLKPLFLIVLLFAASVTVLSQTESAATSDPSPAANKDSAAIQTVKMPGTAALPETEPQDRKSTRLNSSHLVISYAVFCLKKKKYDRCTTHPLTH